MTAFESWATSPCLTVKEDPSLAFEAQMLSDAYSRWSVEAAGAVPHRSAFTARSAKAFLGNLVIFERRDPSRYFVRLMGTHVAAVLGELQGKPVDEALPHEVAQRWTQAIDRMLEQGRPTRIVKRVGFANLDFLQAEIFLAPLLDEHDRVTMAIAVVVFRSGVVAGRGLITADDARHEDMP